MDDGMKATIDTLIAKVEAKTKELSELKRTINFLAKESGEEAIYPDETPTHASNVGVLRNDQFYGKSPIVAAREYLESRGRAIQVQEILAALEKGGFDFDAQGWKKADRLRALAISLGKNTAIFHKLPNGTVGLVKFYPEIAAGKKQKRTASDKPDADEAIDESSGESGDQGDEAADA